MKQNAQSLMIISKLIKTAAGREEIGNSMVQPLREFQDYQSVMRRAFLVDQLADGAIPYYDKDVDNKAYIVSEEGEDIREVAGRDARVFVPLFEIASNPMIPYTQIKQRRYDIQARVQEKTNAEIFRAEDAKLVKLLDKASTGYHPLTTITGGKDKLTIDDLSKAMSKIESIGNGLRCVNIFMNPVHSYVLRKLNKDYYSIDFETSRELISAGYLASIFGAQIHTSSEIPQDKIFFTCEPQYLGRLVESMPLNVLTADDPKNRMVGWSIFEQVGALVSNPKGICAIKITE